MNSEILTKNKISKIRVIVRKRPANHREFSQNDIDIIGTEGKNTHSETSDISSTTFSFLFKGLASMLTISSFSSFIS